ncbi:hypothetical protein [Devosia sp.]|uniref:hypothetical protein n=1 Tax=Devosia sp. TaxID=1871048 RepID=UPI001AC4BF70|nr:hypothetical protein [Devosia sp.]MBN9333045.1 hypothetical protein [Devosia sp.]
MSGPFPGNEIGPHYQRVLGIFGRTGNRLPVVLPGRRNQLITISARQDQLGGEKAAIDHAQVIVRPPTDFFVSPQRIARTSRAME